MTEASQASRHAPAFRWFLTLLIAANLLVIVIVNYSIYWARFAFQRDYPEATAHTIPTISGALSKPSIGVPFAFWVTLSAAVLFIGTMVLIWSWLRALPPGARGPRSVLLLAIPVQAVACIGMVVLSNFTFPDYRDEHMAGSYMFFVGQSIVVLFGLILARLFIRRADQAAPLIAQRVLDPGANRMRAVLGAVIMAMVIGYLALFIGKDMVSPEIKDSVVWAYVNLESLCITAFLLFFGLCQIDLWRWAKSR